MSDLRFADLIDTPVPLSAAEAVTLTLAAADAVAENQRTSLPSDEQIILSSTGHVTLASVATPDADEVTPPLTAQLAALTRRLLRLEKPGGDRRRRVPPTLLIMLSRALGQVALPPPTLDEFRAGLERIATAEATTIAAVFWRAARLRAPGRPYPVGLQAIKAESAQTTRGTDDRRQNIPPASELRRYLRETEKELFEARASAHPVSVRAPARGRVRHISSGVAASVIGAILGTGLAFVMARDTAPPAADVASTEAQAEATTGVQLTQADAVAATSGSSNADAARTQPRQIVTTRSVQPLLLAAAVGADLFSPSFAPRGRTLLFHAGRNAAPLMRASVSDNGEVNNIETLLDDGASNFHVTMSPDGTHIAYDSDREGVRGVYVANADGTEPRRISADGYAAVPSWSPEGGRVAFVRAESKHPRVWNVWIAELATGHLRRVTEHTVGQPWGASWFPDGQHLAYSLEDRLMVADLESGVASGYRSPRQGRLVRTPAVSPDGRWIVFQVQHDGVWLLDVDRARMRRILDDETAEEFVWSPDGGTIAYHARKAGSYGIWRLALSPAGN